MSDPKISPALAKAVEALDGLVELVVELTTPESAGSGTRAEKIASRKADYASQSEPVIAKILELGGDVSAQTWLNGTILATLPKRAVSSLSEAGQVRRLDLPQSLAPDAKPD